MMKRMTYTSHSKEIEVVMVLQGLKDQGLSKEKTVQSRDNNGPIWAKTNLLSTPKPISSSSFRDEICKQHKHSLKHSLYAVHLNGI